MIMSNKKPITIRPVEPDTVADMPFADQYGAVEEDRKARIRREISEALRVGALGESHLGKQRPYTVTLADGTQVEFR